MSFRMNELSNDSFDFEELYSAVFENEISNSDSIALKLILDVDGIAFGYNQFNTKYNSYGYEILRKVGASETEIRDIKVFNSSTIQSDQTFNNTTWSEWKVTYSTTYNSVNNKLKLNKNILLEDAQSFLKNNFLRIKSYLSSENVLFENPSLMMAMFVDYDNQLYFQKNGQIHTWIRTYSNTNNPITLAAYIEWRMDTNWGKINPTNVIQRINVMNKRTYLLEGTVEKTVEVIERKNYTDYFTRINKHLFKVSNSSYSLRNGIGKLKTGSNSERTFKDLYYSSTFYQDTAKEEYLIIIENSITKIIKMLDPNFDQNRDHDMFLRTIGKFQDYQIVPLLSTFNMLVHAYNFVEVALSNEVGEDSYLITKGIIEIII